MSLVLVLVLVLALGVGVGVGIGEQTFDGCAALRQELGQGDLVLSKLRQLLLQLYHFQFRLRAGEAVLFLGNENINSKFKEQNLA